MKLFEKIKNGEIYFIAEMSANHAGKFETAIEIVRRAKESGADCLKVQTYTADTLTINCNNKHFLIQDGLWKGYKLYDLYRQAHMPWEWQSGIKAECERLGMDFLSTPFDKSSVDFLEKLGVEFYKIASFELVDIPLIEYTASKGKPMIISCGMGSVDEISDAVEACKKFGNEDIVLLKCCSDYPAQYSDMNLKTIDDMKRRFNVNVGLSDHSLGDTVAVASIGLGVQVVEKHFCLSRALQSPDSAFSMEPHEFRKMVENVKIASEALGHVSYELTVNEKKSSVFRRSLFVTQDMKKGEAFTENNLSSKRPSAGIKPKYLKDILGKCASRDIEFGTPLTSDLIKKTEKGS